MKEVDSRKIGRFNSGKENTKQVERVPFNKERGFVKQQGGDRRNEVFLTVQKNKNSVNKEVTSRIEKHNR